MNLHKNPVLVSLLMPKIMIEKLPLIKSIFVSGCAATPCKPRRKKEREDKIFNVQVNKMFTYYKYNAIPAIKKLRNIK